MHKRMYLIVFLVVASILLAACGGGDGEGASAEAGRELFEMTVIGSQAGCSTCHSLNEGEVIVGPSLAGIGSRHDEAYIRESILEPNAVLAEGFPADTMPDVWGDELSQEQVDQLVAFLLTLK